MVINKKICPAGLKNNPNRKLTSVSFITIHTTGNRSATATAKSHANYQFGGSGGAAKSWHYTADKDEIWQSFDDFSECWHAGDGNNGPGNCTSIGIEICVCDKAGFASACDNAAWLTATLMRKHNLTIDKVVQHNRWDKKNCPAELRSGEWGIDWNGFIALVKKHYGTLSLSPVPSNNSTRDNPSDIPVIGEPTATYRQAEAWAKSKGATKTFISLAKKYWDYTSAHGGVNPVIAFCQAALETGFGKFGGIINETFHNPCGMKTSKGGSDSEPEAHERFISWEEGVKAHLEHLALYAGASGYPVKNSYDPRHFSYLLGKGKTLEEMAAGWCPGNPNYAAQLKRMMDEVTAQMETTTAKPSAEQIIKALSGKVSISSPDYWVAVLNGKEPVNLEYLNIIFARLAGFDI